jgi:hypothetical protein
LNKDARLLLKNDDNGLYWGIQNKEKFIDAVSEDNSKIP